jgi:hypothetical protein
MNFFENFLAVIGLAMLAWAAVALIVGSLILLTF